MPFEKTFEELEQLSNFNFEPQQRNENVERLGTIIRELSILNNFAFDYDDTKDNNGVEFDDLRQDEFGISFPAEKLLQNTESMFNCYQIPKILE